MFASAEQHRCFDDVDKRWPIVMIRASDVELLLILLRPPSLSEFIEFWSIRSVHLSVRLDNLLSYVWRR